MLPFTRNVLSVAMMKCSTTRYSCVLQMRVLRCSIRAKGADTGSGRITERTFRVRKKKRRMENKRKDGWRTKEKMVEDKRKDGGGQKKRRVEDRRKTTATGFACTLIYFTLDTQIQMIEH